MRKQLADIDAKLFDSQRRKIGTASVLLHGSPGSGKTHVARQYIYSNRSKFEGGIFWINARGAHLEKDLWSLAQKAVAEDSPELRVDSSGKGKDAVSTVRDWFSSRENWLIVLDGVVVDKKQDLEMLENVLPNKPNSSLIYTSRSSQFRISHRLLHPRPVKIPSLTIDEGQLLLFSETNKKRTSRSEKAAAEIVKKVGGLPLAIHAICVRLIQTGEPIEVYRPRSWADDEMLRGPFRAILDELRDEHPPAYNLMNILAFFGPHIPVELIRLGVRGLRSSGLVIKSTTGYSATPEINGSLSILRRNALLERNEEDEITTPTNSSKSTLLEDEPMDVLRLHTVVQKFCRDRLERGTDKEPPQLLEWIDVATRVLKQSYEAACRRMAEREGENPPRVTDHQEYLVHAQEMREHSVAYDHKSRSLKDVRSMLDSILNDINSRLKELKPISSQESVYRTRPVPSVFDRISTTSSHSLTSGDDMLTPDEQEDISFYDQSKWEPNTNEPVQISPRHSRPLGSDMPVNPGRDKSASPNAVEMLRSISERTVRPSSAVSDEDAPGTNYQHNRTVSLPSLNGPNSLFPSATRPFARIDPQNAEGTFALQDGSPGSSPPRSPGMFPSLRPSQSPRRPSALSSFMTPPVTSAQYTVSTAFSPPPPSPQQSQRLTRLPSRPTPAPPMLTTQDIPNPMAAPFQPGMTAYPYQVESAANSGLAHIPGPGYGQNLGPYSAQSQGMAYPVFNPHVFGQSQAISPPMLQPNDQNHANMPSNALPRMDTRFQVYPPNPANPQTNTEMPAEEFYRHERASSVPNMATQSFAVSYADPRRRVSAVSSPTGWPGGYAQPAQSMSRETSGHSNSSGSGSSVVYTAPIPHYYSLYAQPAHPSAQVSPGMSLSPSPPMQVVLGPSPLQSVQNAGNMPSPAIVSPATVGAPDFQASPPPPLVSSGYPSSAYPMEVSAQSSPGTAIISPSATGTYTPVSMVNHPVPGHYSARIPSTAMDDQLSSSPPIAQSMSRTGSNPGPGIAVPGMAGLGIAEFGGPGGDSTQTGAVTFGEHDPVNILEARRRSLANEAILRSEQLQQQQQQQQQGQHQDGVLQPEPVRGGAGDRVGDSSNKSGARPEWGTQSELLPPISTIRDSPRMQPAVESSVPTITGPAPYPDINTMPADTDIRQLQSMMEQAHASKHPELPPNQRQHATQHEVQPSQPSQPSQGRQAGHVHAHSQGAIEHEGQGRTPIKLSRRARRQSEPQREALNSPSSRTTQL